MGTFGFKDTMGTEYVAFFRFCAEFIGTFIIVFIGCGSCVKGWEDASAPTIIHISLAFGLAVCTAVHATYEISGGQCNPIVTLAMVLVGRTKIAQAMITILGQMAGSVSAIALLEQI